MSGSLEPRSVRFAAPDALLVTPSYRPSRLVLKTTETLSGALMKVRRSLLAMTIMGAASAAAAQQPSPVDKGVWIIAGSAEVSRSHDASADVTITSAQFSPSALRFVVPRLAIGASAAAAYSGDSHSHLSTLGLGPSARYFFGDQSARVLPFVSASIFPTWQQSHTSIAGVIVTDGSARTIVADGSLGLTDMLVPNVGLTGEAYYSHSATHVDESSSRDLSFSNYGLRFGLTVFVH
jgi:hypothetical protein